MRILINAVSARAGGGQTYIANLRRFSQIQACRRIVIIVPSGFQFSGAGANWHVIRLGRWLEKPILRNIWENVFLPKIVQRLRIDILFCPGGTLPRFRKGVRCKSVTMFQNMLPFDMRSRRDFPIGYMRLRHWLLRGLLERGMRSASLVIFISNYGREVIESIMPRGIKTSVVIPHGLAPEFLHSEEVKSELAEKLVDRQYYLYVSPLTFYKSQVEVIDAFSKYVAQRDADSKLILVGSIDKRYSKRVKRLIRTRCLEKRVVMAGKVSHSELPTLLKNAYINIFASRSENCPNILLETMAAGRPVLCSNVQPMPEFGEDGVMYIDPYNSIDIAQKWQTLEEDEKKMQELARRAYEIASRYSWGRAAEDTWHAITECYLARD